MRISIIILLSLLFYSFTPMENKNREVAVFGAGCFWCVEAIFGSIKGVDSSESGYTGGHTLNPTYKEVCGGQTGHVEVVKVVFDPDVVSYTDLLEVFFSVHNPTTKDRQGEDVGHQYQTSIFYTSEKQKQTAELVIKTLTDNKAFDAPIVTELHPLTTFYKAEEYHQDYIYKGDNAKQPYCTMVVIPKVEKFKKSFKELLKN